MKKIIMILELLVVILFLFPNITYAEDGQELSTEAILESQQDSLNISSFLKEAQKYTSSVYDDINMGELFTSALTGKIQVPHRLFLLQSAPLPQGRVSPFSPH